MEKMSSYLVAWNRHRNHGASARKPVDKTQAFEKGNYSWTLRIGLHDDALYLLS